MARVLIAEDNRIDQLILERVLNRSGYQVMIAQDGLEALEKLQAEKFDLLITDFFMPKLNGFQLLRKLHDSKIKIRTLILTDSKEDEMQLKSLKLGALDYLAKPINPHLLLAKVQVILGNHTAQEVKPLIESLK